MMGKTRYDGQIPSQAAIRPAPHHVGVMSLGVRREHGGDIDAYPVVTFVARQNIMGKEKTLGESVFSIAMIASPA